MIVICLMGIGIGYLWLNRGQGEQRPHTEETPMTNSQIAAMLADDERARRRARFEQGVGPAQFGRRVESRKRPTRAAGKAQLRKEQW